MRSFVNYFIIFLIPFFTLTQEPKKLTLEDIYFSNTFNQDWVWGLNSMKNGKEYTVIDYIKNDISIDKYSYKSGKKINSILKSSEIEFIFFPL